MNQFAFCAMCLVVLWLLYIADKKNSKVMLCIGILILSFAAGLRNENVGVDTHAYIYSFINDFPIPWQFTETGFRAISRFLMMTFNNNPTVLLFIYAVVTSSLILIRLWDFREKCSYTYMVFLYLTINYLSTMNIMRQFISLAIVFFATRYLSQKKYVLFVLMLTVATTIHSTALMGIVFLIVYFWTNATKKQKKWLLIPVAVVIPVVGFIVLRFESGHINNYFSQRTQNFNITYLYRVFAFVLAMLLQKFNAQITFVRKRTGNKRRISNSIHWSDKEMVFYTIGLGVASLGMFFSVLDRIGMYQLMYEMVFWGRIVKEGKSKQISFALSFVYAIYVFGMELVFNGSKIFPFAIHWF